MRTLLTVLIVLAMAVSAQATEEISLTWEAPLTNEDGTILTDLAGFKVYYGIDQNNLNNVINVGNVTSYTLTNLPPDTGHYIAVTAYDTSNNESGFSNKIGVITQPAPDTEAPSPVNIEITCKVNGEVVPCMFVL